MLAMDAQSVGLKDARVHGQSDSSQARTFTHNGDETETQSLTILDHEHAVGASRRGSFAMAPQPVRRSPRAKPRMGENASVRATGALPSATLAVSSRIALSHELDSAVSFIPREGGDRSVQLFRIRRCALQAAQGRTHLAGGTGHCTATKY